MTPGMNSQRGVPYAPGAAKAHRERAAERATHEAQRQTRRQATLSYARKLDEIEHAYRERRGR
jgi:hypothetical protein